VAYNITQGSTVEFTVEFLDSSGNLTVPSGATLTMTYTSISGTTASSTITMTQSNQFFIATWGSGQAKVGFANYSIIGTGGTPALGQLRLLGP
jgi:hypothetical protein